MSAAAAICSPRREQPATSDVCRGGRLTGTGKLVVVARSKLEVSWSKLESHAGVCYGTIACAHARVCVVLVRVHVSVRENVRMRVHVYLCACHSHALPSSLKYF